MPTLFPLTLRPGRLNETEALVALAVAAHETSIGRTLEFAGRQADLKDAFTAFVSGSADNLIVAEADGEALGFAATEGKSDEISDIWVAPSHQGRGIGALLLAACEARVRAWGYSCAWLTTHAGSDRVLGFYRTHGYALLNVQHAPSVALPDITYPKALLGKQLSRPLPQKAQTMGDVRRGIDLLDPMIVSLLEERYGFIDRAAELKPALAMPARVTDRVEEVVNNARAQAQRIGFDPELTEKLWRMMIDLAIKREEVKMGEDEPSHRVQERAS